MDIRSTRVPGYGLDLLGKNAIARIRICHLETRCNSRYTIKPIGYSESESQHNPRLSSALPALNTSINNT